MLAGGHQQQVARRPAVAISRARRMVSSPAALSAELVTVPSEPGPTRVRPPPAASPARRSRPARGANTSPLPARRTRAPSPPPSMAVRKTVKCGLGERRREIARSPCHSGGPACRNRTSRSLRRRACGGTARGASRPMSAMRRPISGSMVENTRLLVTNDISRSTCVNSGWRSARRSSSRKQLTIWK